MGTPSERFRGSKVAVFDTHVDVALGLPQVRPR